MGSIKEFWEENPVGENLVKRDKNWSIHFKNYDSFRYDTERHILMELDKIDFSRKRVLEIGVGQAADSLQMAKRGAVWYGLDLTDAAKQRAEKRFELESQPYGEVKVGNANEIPWPDNYFDIVYSHGVLHHIPDLDEAQCEISRVLKPNGKLIIMLYHKSSFCYWLSIAIIRRLGLLALMIFEKIKILKLDSQSVLAKHISNARKKGVFSYLKMSNFIHSNTDGPDNPYSKVYTVDDMQKAFTCFKLNEYRCHFINERHFPFLKYVPRQLKQSLASRFGWHLWGFLVNGKSK
jgi:ubiquinone/menaquinone biosynthesis C-methylase UbiE